MAFQLSEIPGIAAVVLGGSWARGTARPDSDLDIGLYYSEQSRPEIEAHSRFALPRFSISGPSPNRYRLLSMGSVGQRRGLDSYPGRKDGPFVSQQRPGPAVCWTKVRQASTTMIFTSNPLSGLSA